MNYTQENKWGQRSRLFCKQNRHKMVRSISGDRPVDKRDAQATLSEVVLITSLRKVRRGGATKPDFRTWQTRHQKLELDFGKRSWQRHGYHYDTTDVLDVDKSRRNNSCLRQLQPLEYLTANLTDIHTRRPRSVLPRHDAATRSSNITKARSRSRTFQPTTGTREPSSQARSSSENEPNLIPGGIQDMRKTLMRLKTPNATNTSATATASGDNTVSGIKKSDATQLLPPIRKTKHGSGRFGMSKSKPVSHHAGSQQHDSSKGVKGGKNLDISVEVALKGTDRVLCAKFYFRKIQDGEEAKSVVIIQSLVRGFIVRRRLVHLKRRALIRHGMEWGGFVRQYRALLHRVQKRNGAHGGHGLLDFEEIAGFLDRKEKYEEAFYQTATGDKLLRKDTMDFFNKCCLQPTVKDIYFAYKQIFKACDNKSEVVFLVECSASVGVYQYKLLKQFLCDVIDGLGVGQNKVRVAYIPFNSNVFESFGLAACKSKQEVRDAIMRIEYNMGTNRTDLAFVEARELLQEGRPGVQKTILLITDGTSSFPETTMEEVNKLTAEKTDIFAIGVGRSSIESTMAELRKITPSEDHVMCVPDYYSISGVKGDTVKKLVTVGCEECTDGVHVNVWDEDLSNNQTYVSAPTKKGDTKKKRQAWIEPTHNETYEVLQNEKCQNGQSSHSGKSLHCPATDKNRSDVNDNVSSIVKSHSSESPGNVRTTQCVKNASSPDSRAPYRSGRGSAVNGRGLTDKGLDLLYSGPMGSEYLEDGRGFFLNEALEMIWMIYPPAGTKLDPMDRSRWMKPMVDRERFNIVDKDVALDKFEANLRTLMTQNMDADGNQASEYEAAWTQAYAYIHGQKILQAEEWERHNMLNKAKKKYEEERKAKEN